MKKMRRLYLVGLVIFRVKNYWDFFMDLLKLTHKKFIVYETRDNHKYYARAKTTDRGIFNAVVLQDEYKISEMKLHDATIIDIGGQNGYFSVYASPYAQKIFIYEPMPENFLIINKNIELNNLRNKLKAYNLAVFGTRQALKIYRSTNTGGHSMFGTTGESVEAKTITLADIFDEHSIQRCDLVKMDIEGAEYDVLYNLPDEYFKKIMAIRMEVHDMDSNQKNHRYLIDFLKSKNFTTHLEFAILFAEQNR